MKSSQGIRSERDRFTSTVKGSAAGEGPTVSSPALRLPSHRRQWRSEPHNLAVFLVGKCCSEEPNQQRVIRLGITTCIHSMRYYSSVRDDLLCAVHLFMLSLHMTDKQTDGLPAIRLLSVRLHCVSRVFSIRHVSLELDDLNAKSSSTNRI